MHFHERMKLRLAEYDYALPGAYFITACVKRRACVFGEIRDGQMHLSEVGIIVERQWGWLHRQYDYLVMDAFVVMPNHVHAILIIADEPYDVVENHDAPHERAPIAAEGFGGDVGNGRDGSLHDIQNPPPFDGNLDASGLRKIKSVPQLIGAFKTTSSKLIHEMGLTDFQWQKSYYDRIIRNETALNNIRRYIELNPQFWERDVERLSLPDEDITQHYRLVGR